jgi:DNA-binding NtrC family response regulator
MKHSFLLIVAGAVAASPMNGTREEAQRFGVGSSIRQVEKELIFATLAYTRGNKPAAARTLGISLKTLYNRLNSYAVER